ncbi:hypothetical protein Goshw_002825 [Gossypium schwendimanii]|uniref:PH domain-containing protein n=1 Tax=Gossypium schwendimanii TaxID=34291 RepID=A0A7J9KPR2_GOSSC|nr:hypothetical protein [Gossypium schwendimanii]
MLKSRFQDNSLDSYELLFLSFSYFSLIKGIGWTSWKKRWFILTHTSLVFFRSDPVSSFTLAVPVSTLNMDVCACLSIFFTSFVALFLAQQLNYCFRRLIYFCFTSQNAVSQKGNEVNLTLGGIDLNNSGSVIVKADKKLITVQFQDGRDGRTFTLKVLPPILHL